MRLGRKGWDAVSRNIGLGLHWETVLYELAFFSFLSWCIHPRAGVLACRDRLSWPGVLNARSRNRTSNRTWNKGLRTRHGNIPSR